MMLSFLQGALNTSIQRYLTYYLGIGDYVKLKRVFVIVAVIPVSKYCTEMQKKKEVSTCYGEIEKPENCLVFV